MVQRWLGELGNSREIAEQKSWLGWSPGNVEELCQAETFSQGWDTMDQGQHTRTPMNPSGEELGLFLGDTRLPAQRREEAAPQGPRAHQAAHHTLSTSHLFAGRFLSKTRF